MLIKWLLLLLHNSYMWFGLDVIVACETFIVRLAEVAHINTTRKNSIYN